MEVVEKIEELGFIVDIMGKAVSINNEHEMIVDSNARNYSTKKEAKKGLVVEKGAILRLDQSKFTLDDIIDFPWEYNGKKVIIEQVEEGSDIVSARQITSTGATGSRFQVYKHWLVNQ